MKEERARTPNALGNDPAAAMKMMGSEEGANQFLAQLEGTNRRVLDRARALLSPDQVLAFEAAQKQFLEAQRMGIQMSRQMMKKP